MKKKVTFTAVTLVFTLLLFIQSSKAGGTQNLGNLSYWYSNESEVAYWPGTSLSMFYGDLNGDSSFPFSTATQHAKNQWNACLPISLSLTTSGSNCDFFIFGGTASTLSSAGFPANFTAINGVTYSVQSLFGDWYYPPTYSHKSCYTLTSVDCLIVNNGNTEAQYKNTITHEMGHGLGWTGHAASSSDIMYPYGTSVTALSNHDKLHLSQIYNYFNY